MFMWETAVRANLLCSVGKAEEGRLPNEAFA